MANALTANFTWPSTTDDTAWAIMDLAASAMCQILNAMTQALGILIPPSVMAVMFGARHKHQVFKSIVTLYSVDVMHDFIVGNRTAKMLRHYQNVLAHIAIFASVRMRRHSKKNISMFNLAAALPSWVFCSSPISFLLPHSNVNVTLHERQRQ